MKKLKILLLGKDGQVGFELQRSLAPLGGLIALGSGKDLLQDSPQDSSELLCGDLLNLPALTETILKIRPDVIVNAAAYTAVDKAETTESEKANLINNIAVGALAELAKQTGALLVHYSTDYVFDGSGTQAWTEEDLPAPLNIYGFSKLNGEKAIQDSGCPYLIFRTSWVYAARGNNFAKTILKLAMERESLKVIDDQIGSPTSARLIADITAHCLTEVFEQDSEQDFDQGSGKIKSELLGLYHLVPTGETSWYGYAKHLLECAEEAGVSLKVHAKDLIPIPTTEYPLPALRPKNSRLSTKKLQQKFGVVLPEWEAGVRGIVLDKVNI